MGGSGGRAGSTAARPERTGGSTLGSGGGGGAAPPSLDCPEARTALLVDVAAAGNGAYALTLLPGSVLELGQDGNRYQVTAEGLTLGWLPGDVSSLLRRCALEGHTYAAALLSVGGPPASPQIRVAVQRL